VKTKRNKKRGESQGKKRGERHEQVKPKKLKGVRNA